MAKMVRFCHSKTVRRTEEVAKTLILESFLNNSFCFFVHIIFRPLTLMQRLSLLSLSMQNLNSLSLLSLFSLHHFPSQPTKTFTFTFLFSSSSCTSSRSQISNPNSNPNHLIANYLIETLGFPKTRALLVSTRFSWIKSTEKPQSVLRFLRNLGFSEPQIQSSVRVSPQILFSDIDKILKPKLEFFQQLGLVGSDLGKLISRNPSLLTLSLHRRLLPCIQILKKLLPNDDSNRDLIRVLQRCNWVISHQPESRLLCNIQFLESCGIVGSQLSMLLKRQPRLLTVRESHLREIVSRVLDMGFSIDSRMLVHAIYTFSCLSNETFRRKLDLFRSFQFSEDECMEMIRRAPALLRTSEKKLRLGIEFFMNTIKFKKTVLVHQPTFLMHSMEGRVIPRYKVLQIMKSKRLLKKDPSFCSVLYLTEEEFLEKFVSRFRDNAEELLVAYKGHILDAAGE